MNSIKWIHENYNYITTNCLLHCPSFHSYQKFLSVLIRYRVHIRKIVQKVTSLQILFRYVSRKRVASQLQSNIKSVLKYLFQVWTKALSNIQFVMLQYNVLCGVVWTWSTQVELLFPIEETIVTPITTYSKLK